MSSWTCVTMVFDKDLREFDDNISVPPTFAMDNGIDERFWIEEEKIFYAMSQGRHQHIRFDKMLERVHDPMFTAVETVAVTKAEDTGDTAEVFIYKSNGHNRGGRNDGYTKIESFEGKRFRDEEKEELKDRVEKEHGFRPIIDPVEQAIKPDMILSYTGDEK